MVNKGGRPRKELFEGCIMGIREGHAEGQKLVDLAKAYEMSRTTLWRRLREKN